MWTTALHIYTKEEKTTLLSGFLSDLSCCDPKPPMTHRPRKLDALEITWRFKTGACAARGDNRGPGSYIRYNQSKMAGERVDTHTHTH